MFKKIVGWVILFGVYLILFGPTFWDAISKYGWLFGILSIVVSFIEVVLLILLLDMALNWITSDKK